MKTPTNTKIAFNHKQLVDHYFERTREQFFHLSEVDWIKKGAFFLPMRPFNAYTPWICRASIQTDGNTKIEQGEEENPFAVVIYLEWPEYSSVIVDTQDNPDKYFNYVLEQLKAMDYIKDQDYLDSTNNQESYCPPNCSLN
jgi:hypothetical protein